MSKLNCGAIDDVVETAVGNVLECLAESERIAGRSPRLEDALRFIGENSDSSWVRKTADAALSDAPGKEPRTRTVEVAADAYKGGRTGEMLRHSLRDGDAHSLCGRIPAENLVDTGDFTDAEPTCERCQKKDSRFSAPAGAGGAAPEIAIEPRHFDVSEQDIIPTDQELNSELAWATARSFKERALKAEAALAAMAPPPAPGDGKRPTWLDLWTIGGSVPTSLPVKTRLEYIDEAVAYIRSLESMRPGDGKDIARLDWLIRSGASVQSDAGQYWLRWEFKDGGTTQRDYFQSPAEAIDAAMRDDRAIAKSLEELERGETVGGG